MGYSQWTSRHLMTCAIVALLGLTFVPDRWCGYARVPHDMLLTGVGWLSGPLENLSSTARRRIDHPVVSPNLQIAEQRRLELEQEVLNLREQLARLREENAALQQLRDRDLTHANVFRTAAVRGVSSQGNAQMLLLQGGATSGFRTSFPVVSGGSVVGRLIQVQRLNSVMEPVTTPDRPVTGVITPPVVGKEGLSEDRRHLVMFTAQDHEHLVAEIPATLSVEVSDIARLRDDAWPDAVQYMMLGQVVEIDPLPEDSLRKKVVVRTLRSIRHLSSVTVIIPGEAAGVTAGAGEKGGGP